MMRFNLWTKFSFFLLLVWLIVGGSALVLLEKHLNGQAEAAITERAEIVINTMQSVRNYTRDNIQPLLRDHPTAFTQEAIPNFAARNVFKEFKQQNTALQDFIYKEATPNPTNLKDLADTFEVDVFQQLQDYVLSNRYGAKEIVGYRDLNDQKMFYLAQPLVVTDTSCLECHGNPKNAPQYLLDMYGSSNGFGWNINDLAAAQIVYVPADMIFERGHQNLVTVARILLSMFGAFFVVVNLLLWRTVITPIQALTKTAKFLSSYSIKQSPHVYRPDKRLKKLTLRRDEPGQLARAFSSMIDILSRREQDLQWAVQERTQSLKQEMLDRKTAQDALQTYSHAMNHDLRNLVIGISTIMQSLLFRASKETTNIQKTETASVTIECKALTMIQQSCDRQLHLMNSLMDVQSADIWQTSLQLSSINLNHLIEELAQFYAPEQFPALNDIVYQSSPSLPEIQGDINQLRRVFENLITNALKYNPGGVDITLTATVCNHDGHLNNEPLIRCSVIDNGIGIEPSVSQNLFKIYARGNSGIGEAGYGLGLYICRKIIEVHGGEIGVSTPAQGGTEFWFTLPISMKN